MQDALLWNSDCPTFHSSEQLSTIPFRCNIPSFREIHLIDFISLPFEGVRKFSLVRHSGFRDQKD